MIVYVCVLASSCVCTDISAIVCVCVCTGIIAIVCVCSGNIVCVCPGNIAMCVCVLATLCDVCVLATTFASSMTQVMAHSRPPSTLPPE